ncbi:hypothetical protein FA13DRAFT_1720650 [Coprinellus micaceus]|uniref:Uncharacterized protein n=1 Tax=Coprinellus micaceus TaxID=71717 RepID=A0A4Y7S7D3_COPMI|nr:hypothetical protein FA13DRAFT_1720650 [Coprinellus micaceus]
MTQPIHTAQAQLDPPVPMTLRHALHCTCPVSHTIARWYDINDAAEQCTKGTETGTGVMGGAWARRMDGAMTPRDYDSVEVKVKGRRTGLELGRPPPSPSPFLSPAPSSERRKKEKRGGRGEGAHGPSTISSPASLFSVLSLPRSLCPPLSSLIQSQTDDRRRRQRDHSRCFPTPFTAGPNVVVSLATLSSSFRLNVLLSRAPKLDRNPLAPPAREEGLGEALRSRAAAVFVGGEEGGEASMFAFWFWFWSWLGCMAGRFGLRPGERGVEREERKKKEEDPTPCTGI